MRLYLCEKPSQGKDIAKVLGATQRSDGCIVGQGVTVTWCIGHLLETAPPESYGEQFKKWSLDALPIIPQHWQVIAKENTLKQFKVVQKLLGKATELVIATDADREGEMIAREIIDYCGYKGQIKRMWLSALNDASIRKALSELKPGSETLSMYYSALSRSRADWLIGMNLSRLFTLLGRKAGYEGVLSVGRVQTPTLGLVARRDREIENFVPVPYWVINVALDAGGTGFMAHWQAPDNAIDDAGRCIEQTAAQTAIAKLKNAQAAQVLSVQTERMKEAPPLAFDLGTLQEACSRKFGLDVQETLDIAQALYEKHKATTYPRTDCGYLPESMIAEIPAVLKAVVQTDPAMQPVIATLDTSLRSRIWNDKKISAHHGIIPTLEAASLGAMSDKERQVYELVRSHYLAQFLPPHEYDRTVAQLSCEGETLQATGKQIILMGWRSLFNRNHQDKDADGTDENNRVQVLPPLAQGMTCAVQDAELKALKTLPPKPYTQGELIKAMKGVARLVTDPRLKQILKDTTGIGTEATRAGIIQGLLQRGYLVTKGKAVRATDAAFTLIDAVPQAIADPDMTALWEQALEAIEKGEMRMEDFVEKQSAWVRQLVSQYAQTSLSIKIEPSPSCPSCGLSMRRRTGKNGAFWSCSKYPECKGVLNISGGKSSKNWKAGKGRKSVKKD
ncbi:DNA topoisomerase III [Saezia sanguinis]|uniref:DNA topoisomerase III n=1 Tax=Saezia sanguinis TaxID=1965230 RepID=UPI00305EE855